MRSALVALVLVGCAAPVARDDAARDEEEARPPAELHRQADEPLGDALRCADLGRYEVRGDVVVDTSDGRLWQREPAQTTMSQEDAALYCSALRLDDRDGWRLPDAGELANIRYKPALVFGGPATCSPSIDPYAFPSTPPSPFWTSTMHDEEQGIYTDFADGRSHHASSAEPMNVRCVLDSRLNLGRRGSK